LESCTRLAERKKTCLLGSLHRVLAYELCFAKRRNRNTDTRLLFFVFVPPLLVGLESWKQVSDLAQTSFPGFLCELFVLFKVLE
jgi:hypothetical protein